MMCSLMVVDALFFFFFFQAEDGIRDLTVTGVQTCALPILVRVRGSAYRHEGAKLLVAEDGSTVGNVSGGCLEQDVREVALQVLGSGTPELKSYCSSSDEIAAWDLGVGCEGQVDVLVEPVVADRPRERALLDGRESFVVCTLIDGKRETGNGKRMIVTRGEVQGDLGLAELSGAAAARARALLGTERSEEHTSELQSQSNLVCRLLLEKKKRITL